MTSAPQFAADTFAPEAIADQVLEELVTDRLGALALPIDTVALARRLGAEVFEMELEPDVSAMLEGERGQRPRIYLNFRDTVARRRFSCGHEIGHLLRRRASGADEFGFIDRRSHLAEQGTDEEEVWANRFAAALTMPGNLIRGIPAEQRRHPERLAPTFGVSTAAMANRLKNAGRPR